MAPSSRQKRITGRVMHEFKHGELKSGRGGKVRSQAIASRSKKPVPRKLENALRMTR